MILVCVKYKRGLVLWGTSEDKVACFDVESVKGLGSILSKFQRTWCPASWSEFKEGFCYDTESMKSWSIRSDGRSMKDYKKETVNHFKERVGWSNDRQLGTD